MPIYLEGGEILLDGGAIAVHEDCCCEGEPTLHSCSDIIQDIDYASAEIEMGFNWEFNPDNADAICDGCLDVPPTSAVIPWKTTDNSTITWSQFNIEPYWEFAYKCSLGFQEDVLTYSASLICPDSFSPNHWRLIGGATWGRTGGGGNITWRGNLLIHKDIGVEFGRSYTLAGFPPAFVGPYPRCWVGPGYVGVPPNATPIPYDIYVTL